MNSAPLSCAEIERDQIIERYLAGGLAEDARLRLEEHYFNCDTCFAELEAMRAIRTAVAESGRPAVVEARPRRLWRMVWGTAALAAAAALVLVMSKPGQGPRAEIARKSGAPASSEPDITMLARVEAPPYSAPILRGGGDEAARAFQAAMQSYSRQDYRAAAAALGEVLAKYPDSTDTLYFLGICDLLNGDAAKASGELQRIAAAGDATPYREEAEYYLALSYVKRNQKAPAMAELERVIAMHRDYETKAKALAAELGH